MRYLFATYPSVRGRTLFRAKDRLFLTKGIIDGFFDMGIFKEHGIIKDFMALHDANRGDIVTIGTYTSVLTLQCVHCIVRNGLFTLHYVLKFH